MSEPTVPDGRGEDNGAGDVLRNLPRTRPQRPSARRTHADKPATTQTSESAPNGASAQPAETTADAPPTKAPRAKRAAKAKATPKARAGTTRAGTTKPAAKAGARRTARPSAKTAGKTTAKAHPPSGAPQGFEAETSAAVNPPGPADVLDAALGTAGDLVQSGLELGGRAVRGALSRLLGG